MIPLTPGKAHGLTVASNDAGIFTILAVDHRDALRSILSPADPESVTPRVLTDLKLEIAAAARGVASAVLLDPEYSAIEAVTAGTLGRSTALLVALEAQGYGGDPTSRVTTLLEGWGVREAKLIGAAGVKLLLPYRPDGSTAAEQEALVVEVVEACRTWDMPLFLEPIGYRLPTDGDDSLRRWIVCESVRRLGPLGPDVLKVTFPEETASVDRAAWADACAELDEAAPVPWTLLSGGGSFSSFLTQVEVACSAGASGFLVGRALWGDVVVLEPDERRAAIATTMVPSLRHLADVATSLGRDWRGAVPPVEEGSWA